MAHLNVEFKARCDHPDEIVQRLLALGAQSQGVDSQTDVYYRVAKGRLKLRRGEVENNLIHYDRPDTHAPKESQVSMVSADAECALDDVLDAALERDVVVSKQRHILWLENVKFHVDGVAGLGSFLEIEAIDYNGDLGRETLQEQCHKYMHALGVSPDQLEARSYSDMLRTGT